jgi:hypothetical protein
MKIWAERIIKNTNCLKRISEYYQQDTNLEYYQKVQCYNISDGKLKDTNINKIKLESTSHKKHKLTSVESQNIQKYIEHSLDLFNSNDIYLTELDLKYYEKVHNSITNKEEDIDTEIYDYIIIDMKKSTKRGFN